MGIIETVRMRGSYDGSSEYFSGLAVDEVMLMLHYEQAGSTQHTSQTSRSLGTNSWWLILPLLVLLWLYWKWIRKPIS